MNFAIERGQNRTCSGFAEREQSQALEERLKVKGKLYNHNKVHRHERPYFRTRRRSRLAEDGLKASAQGQGYTPRTGARSSVSPSVAGRDVREAILTALRLFSSSLHGIIRKRLLRMLRASVLHRFSPERKAITQQLEAAYFKRKVKSPGSWKLPPRKAPAGHSCGHFPAACKKIPPNS